MHNIHLFLRIFPFVAFAIILTSIQFGLFFRRKNSVNQWYAFGIATFFAILTVLWIVYRGDLHSDRWVREFFAM